MSNSATSSDDLVLPISSIVPATPSTLLIRLDLGGSPFDFHAGQAALIGLAERDERIPYSIASAPCDVRRTGLLDFLIKVDASGRWGDTFEGLEPDARLGVRGPMGSFVFPANPAEERFLFIAGGTGIAPIRAIIRQALVDGQRGTMRLLYSAKRVDDFAYVPELGEMAKAHGLDLRLHVTREANETWAGERGRIGMSQLAPLIDDPATLCFVCGPETMVADVPRMLLDLGIDRDRIRLEEW